MNTIKWSDKAIKQALKIKEKTMRARIFEETQVLADFPRCANVKKLTNAEYPYRLRVGDYRVFFVFDGAVSIVFIEEVKNAGGFTFEVKSYDDFLFQYDKLMMQLYQNK